MDVSVEFHFDFGSPNAYLAHLVIPAIEKRSGVRFTYVPVLLGGVFKGTGNVSPAVSMRGIVISGRSSLAFCCRLSSRDTGRALYSARRACRASRGNRSAPVSPKWER